MCDLLMVSFHARAWTTSDPIRDWPDALTSSMSRYFTMDISSLPLPFIDPSHQSVSTMHRLPSRHTTTRSICWRCQIQHPLTRSFSATRRSEADEPGPPSTLPPSTLQHYQANTTSLPSTRPFPRSLLPDLPPRCRQSTPANPRRGQRRSECCNTGPRHLPRHPSGQRLKRRLLLHPRHTW